MLILTSSDHELMKYSNEHPDDNNLPSVPFAVLLILTYEKDPPCECDFLENRWPLQEICEKERCMWNSLPFKLCSALSRT